MNTAIGRVLRGTFTAKSSSRAADPPTGAGLDSFHSGAGQSSECATTEVGTEYPMADYING